LPSRTQAELSSRAYDNAMGVTGKRCLESVAGVGDPAAGGSAAVSMADMGAQLNS
jgi:hypothetical protein